MGGRCMSTITKVLLAIFFAYVAQSILAYFQIKRSYKVIEDVKGQHRGEPVSLVTGTGRTAILLIARGYFIILLVDENDVIVDYYGMDGYTVFASPKRKEQYIGMTLDEAQATLTKKNEKRAFANAREQLDLLRDAAEVSQEISESDELDEYEAYEYEDEYDEDADEYDEYDEYDEDEAEEDS